jgi:hypothetical protein
VQALTLNKKKYGLFLLCIEGKLRIKSLVVKNCQSDIKLYFKGNLLTRLVYVMCGKKKKKWPSAQEIKSS